MTDTNFTNLLVLGAGFSAPAGIPVMSKFFPEAWNLIRAGTGLGGHQDSQSSDKVYDWNVFCEVRHEWFHWANYIVPRYIVPCYKEKNPNDMEQFFLYVQSEKPKFRENLIYVILRSYDLCKERKVGQNIPSPTYWECLYRKIAKELGNNYKKVAILTFNYDILLDQALLQENYKPNYCLDNIESINLIKEYEKEVTLLKPHGSINWLVCNKDYEDCQKITVDFHPGPKGPYGLRPGNWQTGTLAVHGEKHNLPPLLMVPPEETEEKNRAKDSREKRFLESVNRKIESILSQVKKVAFVGWSIPSTDKRYRQSFHKTLKNNCLEAWIVDISKTQHEKLIEKYKELLPSNCQIKDYIDENKGDIVNFQSSGWWDEFLR